MGAAEKIRPKTFKHIEAELEAYWDSLNELKELKDDIIHGSPYCDYAGGSRTNWPGDPTGRAVVLLTTHKRIEMLERITQAIRTVYERQPSEKKKLIQLKYWTWPRNKTWAGIAQELHISERQAYRWRDEIIREIADQLGWR